MNKLAEMAQANNHSGLASYRTSRNNQLMQIGLGILWDPLGEWYGCWLICGPEDAPFTVPDDRLDEFITKRKEG